MAETILNDVTIKFSTESSSGTPWDATDRVQSVNLIYECDKVDKTKEGSSHRQYAPTIKNWSANIKFNNDFADSQVQDKMWQYFNTTGGYVTFGKGGTNRLWAGSFVIESLPIIVGSVGALAQSEITILGCGNLVRTGEPLFFDADQLYFDSDELWF